MGRSVWAVAVVVVGAGIAGIACARELAVAGVEVRVLERARVVGGRMASRHLHGRPVDLGAAYFTASDPTFTALAEGWQRIARYGETWISYRTASERMKREQRLYVNGAGAYRNVDEDEAYLRFVEAIEAIIAEEQQIYWQNRGSEPLAGQQPKSAASSNTVRKDA